MDNIIEIANSIRSYFISLPEVQNCTIYGSVANNTCDEYSDIDIELDVSGCDNSFFALKVPEILGRLYPVIFFDYAPSLMPDNYVVSNAISTDNPFLMVDIKCVATPHFMTVSKSDFPYALVDHTLKVFVANLKHFIRGVDCFDDIARMHKRVCGQSDSLAPENMMKNVFDWLEDNIDNIHQKFFDSLGKFLSFYP